MFPTNTCVSELPPKTLAALQRLLEVAHRGTGQSRVVALFLLSLYNGTRFPFGLTKFRRLDTKLFEDCLLVLIMDSRPWREVHEYFENGGRIWEGMASEWNFNDYENLSWR